MYKKKCIKKMEKNERKKNYMRRCSSTRAQHRTTGILSLRSYLQMTHLITDDEYVLRGKTCVPPLPRGLFSSAAAVVLGFSM